MERFVNNTIFRYLYIFVIIVFFTSCTSLPEPPATPTAEETPTPEPTVTTEPMATIQPTPKPIYISIGSPFPSEWGTPRIWSNDSFNGPADFTRIDDHHGHVDIAVPKGYEVFDGFDIDSYIGDVIAPIDGCVSIYKVDQSDKGIQNYGLHLIPEKGVYIDGIKNALVFAGIENPNLKKISRISIDLGHVKDIKEGCFNKGDHIAEIEPFNKNRGQTKVGFNIWIFYENVEYGLTPTLFEIDQEWYCFENSPYDCEPESHDYAP